MQNIIDKAAVLIEALPYIRRFANKVIVIKYGGHAMTEDALRESFSVDVVLLKYIGLRPVVVHGGGPQIGKMLSRVGKESDFVDGMRVTDDETMEIVEMVLGGKVNQDIVSLIQRGGGRALGLTGKDGGMLRVKRKLVNGQDVGRVGQIVNVDPSAIASATDAGFIPVVAPLGVDDSGLTYNVNADDAAGAIACAIGAEKLMMLTDVTGVLDAKGELIQKLTPDEARARIEEGVIKGGMIPKVECCLSALDHGVERTHIVDGRMLHAVLLEIFTDVGVGTCLTL
ncbi:MAG: acetylglutamate kinase [Deltaproteobacteria bacterium]|nr:acetylglutamate kinase [Deltaproteobacteria bacterium]